MNMKKLVLISTLVGLIAAPALAGPTWTIGDPGTTHQEWTFDDDDNPAPPEVDQNPYGDFPELRVDFSGNHIRWEPTYNSHEGVWYGDPISIELTIPNAEVRNPYKDIWVQVIFKGNPWPYEVITEPAYDSLTVLGDSITGSYWGWKTWDLGLRLVPNPDSEVIRLKFDGSGAYVDKIVVDTICIPAPGAVLLGSIGVGLVGWLRRRHAF